MNITEAIAEARENVARNYTTEPCVIRTLLHALDSEREKSKSLCDSAANVAMIGRAWLTVWGDKFSENSVREFVKAEGAFLVAASSR